MKTIYITRALRTTLAALVILAGLAVFSSVPVHAHCAGKHGSGHPHCDGGGDPGGGEGSSEIMVETTIGNSTGIENDSQGPYIHNVDNVRNLFNTSGYFVLTMHKRQNRAGIRKVVWNLPQAVILGGVDPINGTADLVNHKTVIQVGKFTNIDLRALDPGVPEQGVDMLLDLILFNGNKPAGDVLFVRYSPDGSQCDSNSTGSATVTRTVDGNGKNHWTIMPVGDACMYTSDDWYGTNNSFGTFVLTIDEL